MQTVMYIVPTCIILFLVIRKTIRIYKDGLFLALLQLGLVGVSAALSFALTRLIFNPAKTDFMGLGQKVIDLIPADFFLVCPSMEAFARALPTALIALIAFTVFFEILRVNGAKILSRLNKKYGWSEKFLHFPGNKYAALAVGLVTAVLALLIDLVVLNGVVTFSANMLRCAEAATGQASFGVMAQAMEEFEKSPVKRITDAMGCKQVFHALTTGSRNGEVFSVGEELTALSSTFAGIMPVFDVIPTDDHLPEADAIRSLPAVLASTPQSVELITALVRSSQKALGESDAALVVSTLMGISPEQLSEYLSALTVETAEADLQTFCNIVALLREYDLLPKKGEMISLKDLNNPALLEEVAQEIRKNEAMAAFFDLSSQSTDEEKPAA